MVADHAVTTSHCHQHASWCAAYHGSSALRKQVQHGHKPTALCWWAFLWLCLRWQWWWSYGVWNIDGPVAMTTSSNTCTAMRAMYTTYHFLSCWLHHKDEKHKNIAHLSITQSITASRPHTVTPSHHHSSTPSYHPGITPSQQHTITPASHHHNSFSSDEITWQPRRVCSWSKT